MKKLNFSQFVYVVLHFTTTIMSGTVDIQVDDARPGVSGKSEVDDTRPSDVIDAGQSEASTKKRSASCLDVEPIVSDQARTRLAAEIQYKKQRIATYADPDKFCLTIDSDEILYHRIIKKACEILLSCEDFHVDQLKFREWDSVTKEAKYSLIEHTEYIFPYKDQMISVCIEPVTHTLATNIGMIQSKVDEKL